ncbi:MAG: hypothetical protein IIA89_15660 [Chloroflexi bacterium]|nr:hypothetical protein [Chloroflexota bacterium]
MSSQRRSMAYLIVSALAIASCRAQTESPQVELLETESPDEGQALSRADYLFSPAETAQLLSDAETVTEGVWAVLSNLGLGVYTGEADQVLPGSETGPDDFWLYDFEVPMLAQMALDEPLPFALMHARIAGLGYDGSADDLLQIYHDVYADHPDEYLVQLLAESGLSFTGQPTLTPLQEWLLLLDTFVPPNGSSSAARTGHLASPALQVLCGTIRGGQVFPHWGIIQGGKDLQGLMAAEAAYYALHGQMLATGARGTLEASSDEAHEGHDGPGDTLKLTATVHMTYVPHNVPVGAISCGVLLNMDPPILGPVEGVEVTWNIFKSLHQHGQVDVPSPSLTNSFGKAEITFQARQEEAGVRGDEQEITGIVSAQFDIKTVLMTRYGLDPRVLALVPDRMPIYEPVVITIKWHETAWLLLTMRFELLQPGEFASITWDGLFVVGEDGKLDGEGMGTILVHADQVGCIGGDQTGYDSEVSFGFEIGGQSRPRVIGEGNEFVIEISGTDHKATTTLSNPECEIDDENLFNIFFIGFAKDPKSIADRNIIVASAEPGKETINNTAMGAPIIVSVEAAGTGE